MFHNGAINSLTNESGGTIAGNNSGICVSDGAAIGAIENSGARIGGGIFIQTGSISGSIDNENSGVISGSTGIIVYNGGIIGGITNESGRDDSRDRRHGDH